MANKYGEGALIAARQESPADSNPVARWDYAMARLYLLQHLAAKHDYDIYLRGASAASRTSLY